MEVRPEVIHPQVDDEAAPRRGELLPSAVDRKDGIGSDDFALRIAGVEDLIVTAAAVLVGGELDPEHVPIPGTEPVGRDHVP